MINFTLKTKMNHISQPNTLVDVVALADLDIIYGYYVLPYKQEYADVPHIRFLEH